MPTRPLKPSWDALEGEETKQERLSTTARGQRSPFWERGSRQRGEQSQSWNTKHAEEGAKVARLEESIKDDNESKKKIYISNYFTHCLFVMIKPEILP